MMLLKSILSTPPTSFLVDPPASDTEDVKLTNPLVNLNSPQFVQSVHSKAEPGSSQHKNTNKSKFAALSKEELLQQIKVRETVCQCQGAASGHHSPTSSIHTAVTTNRSHALPQSRHQQNLDVFVHPPSPML